MEHNQVCSTHYATIWWYQKFQNQNSWIILLSIWLKVPDSIGIYKCFMTYFTILMYFCKIKIRYYHLVKNSIPAQSSSCSNESEMSTKTNCKGIKVSNEILLACFISLFLVTSNFHKSSLLVDNLQTVVLSNNSKHTRVASLSIVRTIPRVS